MINLSLINRLAFYVKMQQDRLMFCIDLKVFLIFKKTKLYRIHLCKQILTIVQLFGISVVKFVLKDRKNTRKSIMISV